MEDFIYLYPCLCKAVNIQLLQCIDEFEQLSDAFKNLSQSFKVMREFK